MERGIAVKSTYIVDECDISLHLQQEPDSANCTFSQLPCLFGSTPPALTKLNALSALENIDKAITYCVCNKSGCIMDSQSLHHICAMYSDRVYADIELSSNLFV